MRGVLNRCARLARERCDVDALDLQRHLQPRCEIPAKLLVRICIGAAKQMVQMRRAREVKALGLGNVAQHEQERDRVGSAGQGYSHSASRWQQAVGPNRTADGIDDDHCARGATGALGATSATARSAKGAASAPYAPTAPVAPNAPEKMVPVQGLEPRTTRI